MISEGCIMRRKIRFISLASAALLGAVSSLHAAQPLSQDELSNKVEELEQQLRILKRQLELDKEAAAEKAKTAPLVSIGADGLTMRSADTNFILRFRATLQADGRFYPDNAPGTAENTFLMRRVRPIFEGTVFERFDYRLMLDFGSGLSSSAQNVDFVQEAYVNARLWPEFQIQAGKFKGPVGLERLKADTDMTFIERNYPTQLVPNREVGGQFQGSIGGGLLSYQLGVFNGVADSGSEDIETSDGDKDFEGRLFARPFLNTKIELLQGLGIGLAGTTGHQKGPLRSYVTPGQQKFFSYRTGVGTNSATANVSADGEHWRLAPQAYYYWGPFGILGEYVISDQVLSRAAGASSSSADIGNTAWQLTASYLLTGEQNTFGSIVPKRPVSFTGGGGWGAWELAAQVGQLHVDPKAFPLYANPATSARQATSWGVGLNWYPNRNVKLMLDYERTDFDGGDSSPLMAKGENVFLTRIQLAF
jgi:phosphate-selective porin OprO/OprP